MYSVCALGAVWEELLPSLVQHLQKDYLWCRVCERLVTGVPDRCLEATVAALLIHAPWYMQLHFQVCGPKVLNHFCLLHVRFDVVLFFSASGMALYQSCWDIQSLTVQSSNIYFQANSCYCDTSARYSYKCLVIHCNTTSFD